jgi:hypothetical protein
LQKELTIPAQAGLMKVRANALSGPMKAATVAPHGKSAIGTPPGIVLQDFFAGLFIGYPNGFAKPITGFQNGFAKYSHTSPFWFVHHGQAC